MAQQEFFNIPVHGTLAYDYQTALPFPEKEWETPRPRRDERKVVIPAPPVEEEREDVLIRTRPRQSLSPFALIGFACAAVLLVFTLMAKIQLTMITDRTVGLETQLSELELAQSRLLIQYETVFNRTEIEEYAINTLGMQRPCEEQIVYLNSSAPDKAVVLSGGESAGGFLDRVSEMFGFIAEYFR